MLYVNFEKKNMARVTNKATTRTNRSDSARFSTISPDSRQHMIGEAAYYRYVQRGFDPGHDLEDWLAAEAEFERLSRTRQTIETDAPESDATEEFGMQHGGTLSPSVDEALKRVIKGHPRRDIPRIESMEPEDAPPKE
jgi:Protein of unknown function (DUF2934)